MILSKFYSSFATPFLFVLFPILFLFSRNIEQTAFKAVIVPTAAALLGASALYLCARFFLVKDKAVIFTSIFILIFFSFGHLRIAMDGITFGGIEIGRDRYIFAALFLLFAAATHGLIQTKRDIAPLTRGFQAAGAGLLIVSFVTIGAYEIQHGFLKGTNGGAGVTISGDQDGARPNIYYIILDGYGSADTLAHVYNFDNEPFLKTLEKDGWFVARKSTANYTQTFLSLASSLAMRHIIDLRERIGENAQDRAIPYQMIERSEAQRFLESHGYRFIHISSGSTEMTASNRYADINFKGGKIDEFSLTLFETTAAYPFARRFLEADARGRVLYSFDALKRISALNGPRFTFAHIVLPHPPFVFGPHGEPIKDALLKPGFGNEWGEKDKYIDQVKFANEKVLETMSVILREERTPPIIIIQGDHGPASEGKSGKNGLTDPNDHLIKERMKILNAYYLPEGTLDFYDSVTPVNSFILILNRYFDTALALQPDINYFSDYEYPYQFRDVTEVAQSEF